MKITVQGITEAMSLIGDARARASNLQPAFLGPIDTLMICVISDRFDAEGDAWGGRPWAGLTPNTLRRRKTPGHGLGGVLWDTGRLRASLVSGVGEGFKTASEFVYARGTTVPYARFYGGGSTRPIFDMTDPEPIVTPIKAMLAQFIATGALPP